MSGDCLFVSPCNNGAPNRAPAYSALRFGHGGAGKSASVQGMTNSADHILVVDDDPEIRHLLKQYLEKNGYQVTTVGDDEELGEKIRRDVDDMQAMVDATLDFMRGTESHEEAYPLDLMALLESLRDDAQETGGRVRLSGFIARPYRGRPLALKRCIGNLLDNALRYGGRADIQAKDSDELITLTIADRGPAIPSDAMERVFEPFVRLEGSRARDSGGTGLGLGIARNIARAHGGDLVLKNRDGGGLVPELSLPR